MTGLCQQLEDLRAQAWAKIEDPMNWIQGEPDDGNGGFCAHGAVLACDPQPGDQYILSAVLRQRGLTEAFNDEEDTAHADIAQRYAAEVTDAELAATFGPQWAELVALIRRVATMAPRDAPWDATRAAARAAAWNAARAAGRATARNAVWDAVWDAAVWEPPWDAAWGAVALVGRDLIGDTFTQAHYDLLTGPLTSVIGPIHPDDLPHCEGGAA